MRNLDFKIENYLKNIIKNENISFIIFVITEFKLFLNNFIEYYFKEKYSNNNDDLTINFDNNQNLIHEFVINQDNNIFKKMLSKSKIKDFLKIFYRLGLHDHEEEEANSKFIFVFNLNAKIIKKMNYIISFIDILIKSINT